MTRIWAELKIQEKDIMFEDIMFAGWEKPAQKHPEIGRNGERSLLTSIQAKKWRAQHFAEVKLGAVSALNFGGFLGAHHFLPMLEFRTPNRLIEPDFVNLEFSIF